MATAIGWEDLRKQARYLENEIDIKLVAFSKLGLSQAQYKSSDSEPLLDNDEYVFDNMCAEIEDFLKKLQNINERMSEQPVGGAAMLHTLQRHREILRDYQQEYSRTKNNFTSRKEREDLLRSSSIRSNNSSDSEIGAYKGLSRRDMYYKEHQHLQSSDSLINDQIKIAVETKEHLVSQRQSLKHMRTRLNDLSHRFPLINSLIQRISFRRKRDSIIIGLVISCCTLLILLYLFH